MTKARDIATSEVVTGEIGSTIQAHDDDLDSIAALDKTDGNVIVGDGTNWVAESGATARTSLGLGSAATTDSTDYATAAQGALADTSLQPSDIGTSVLSPTGDGSSLTGIAGGFSNMQVFTSPGTWTNPGSVQKVKVTVVGGGGGGGKGQNTYGAGGGGGGTAIEIIPFPTATNVPVTIGSGGTAGNTTNSNGNSGGTSSFGAYCSASGGSGTSLPGPRSTFSQLGGDGGVGSGGQLNIGGSDGMGGVNSDNHGGCGGNSFLGGGGKGVTDINTGGQPGNSYGGGGGSGSGGGYPTPAGNGAAGVVIVEY